MRKETRPAPVVASGFWRAYQSDTCRYSGTTELRSVGHELLYIIQQKWIQIYSLPRRQTYQGKDIFLALGFWVVNIRKGPCQLVRVVQLVKLYPIIDNWTYEEGRALVNSYESFNWLKLYLIIVTLKFRNFHALTSYQSSKRTLKINVIWSTFNPYA